MDSVFVHRSRDHDAAIRADCVHELGVWFNKHPSYFLEAGFLPYLGKSLSDQNSSVRLEAAKSITALYTKKDYIVSVNHFTQTFKPRMIDMAIRDIDLSVRLSVIHVLLGIEELGLLEDEEREQLCLLIFGADGRVRKAVAPFVKQAWAEEVDQHLVGRSMTGENAEKEQQRAGAKCLASLLIKWSKSLKEDRPTADESDDGDDMERTLMKDQLLRESTVDRTNHDRISLAVEAVWEDMEFIRKWNGLLGLLLMDHTSEVDGAASASKGKKKKGMRKDDSMVEEIWRLSDEEEEVLLGVLLAALRRATEEAKAHPKADTAVEPDDDNASLDDITLVLLKALPRLFIKHQTDASRISNVLILPQLINVGMYLRMRMMSAYEALWDDVSKQFMNHTSAEVIRHAVGTIRHLLSTTSLQNTNKKKMGELEEELANVIRNRVGGRAKPNKGGKRVLDTATLNEDEVQTLSTMLYRVENLVTVKDMTSWMEDDEGGKEVRMLDILTSLMERAKIGDKEEDNMIEEAIKVLCTYLLWKTNSTLSHPSKNAAEIHALRQSLKQQRDSIVDSLIDFIVGEDSQVTEAVKRTVRHIREHHTYIDEVKYTAFLTAMNIHLVYHATDAQRPLADLKMNLEEEVQFRLAGYIQAVIEEYADQLEEDRHAQLQEELSDTEMDSDNAESKPKKRGRKKKTQNGADSNKPPSISQMNKDFTFYANVAPFINGVRAGAISFDHSAVILTHYGRFGVVYDQLAKVLTEILRARWLKGDNAAVTLIVKNSMRGAYNLYLNDQVHKEEPASSLAKLFATHFIHRGPQLAVLGRLSSATLFEIHKDLIDYLVRKLRHSDNDEASITHITSLFRVLSHLVPMGTTNEDLLKLKQYLDTSLEKAAINMTSSEKQWEGIRVYERKLTNAPKEKVTTGRKRGRPKADAAVAASDGEELEGGQNGLAKKPPKARTRPVQRRSAKDKASGSSASEAEPETEPPVRKPKARASSGKKRKARSDEEEEEQEEAPLVLNGIETPPRNVAKATPFQSASKGSARKRRRGSEEPAEETPSRKRQPEKEIAALPATNEADDDDENFVGRRLKRIKR